VLHRFKLLLIATLALSALSTAAARSTTIEFSPGGAITAPSLGKLTFTGGAINWRCNFTLAGTLSTSTTAAAGNQIGAISRVEVASCEGFSLRSINNLPYSLLYSRLLAEGLEFTITRWNMSFSGVLFGIVVDCTYGGTVPVLLTIAASATGLFRVLTNSLAKTAGGGSCPASVSMSGSFGLTQQTVTLV